MLQGSCLGPVEFTEYSSPVFSVINQHGKLGHAYAGEHQVYCGFHPDSLYSNCESMERCIRDINSWMQGTRFKMNNSKTEYILIGTPQQLATCTNTAINLGDYEVQHGIVYEIWALILINTCLRKNMSSSNVGQPMRHYITSDKSENI